MSEGTTTGLARRFKDMSPKSRQYAMLGAIGVVFFGLVLGGVELWDRQPSGLAQPPAKTGPATVKPTPSRIGGWRGDSARLQIPERRITRRGIAKQAPAESAHCLAGRGGGAGVLRLLAAEPVHGPDQSAVGNHPQAAAVGARTGRAHA